MQGKIVFYQEGWRNPVMNVQGKWDEDIIQYVIDNQIDAINICQNGLVNNSFSYLSLFHHLKYLYLIEAHPKGIEAISELERLEYLYLDIGGNNKINFSKFTNLRRCTIQSVGNVNSLYGCTSLEKLIIWDFKNEDSSFLSSLVHLESLDLVRGNLKEISGISKLSNLKRLVLAYLKKIDSIEPIMGMDSLETIIIQGCKGIYDLSPLAYLKNLNYLKLDNIGQINSLKPISNCPNLKTFIFDNSTSEDGNLDFLLKMPNLHVGFRDRKHYSLTMKELKKIKLGTEFAEKSKNTSSISPDNKFTLDKFWEMIDSFSSMGNLEKYQEKLCELSPEMIIAYQIHLDSLFKLANIPYLWDAAYIINEGCSEDCFIDFRYGLISKGKKIFYKTISDPDSLADIKDTDSFFNESFGYAAIEAYEKVTTNDFPYDDIPTGDPEKYKMGYEPIDEIKVEVSLTRLKARYMNSEME